VQRGVPFFFSLLRIGFVVGTRCVCVVGEEVRSFAVVTGNDGALISQQMQVTPASVMHHDEP
jgi:hypothetical protein